MHNSVRRAFRVVEPLFDEIILQDQNLFAKQSGLAKLLSTVSDEKLRVDLEATLKECPADDSKAIWLAFKKFHLGTTGSRASISYVPEHPRGGPAAVAVSTAGH